MLGPRYVRPCVPIRATEPRASAGWLHEPKLDGYRLQIVKSGRVVRLFSRKGNDWTKRLTAIAEALANIPCQSAVIDAELVLPGADGAPDFYGLQAGLSSRERELVVFAFDLMFRDGVDLCPLPLVQRKHQLASVVRG